MPIFKNFSLLPYNTFHILTSTLYFAQILHIEEIPHILNEPTYNNLPHLVLGYGSNVLFTKPFPGIVFHMGLLGIQKISEDSEYVWIKAEAGESWEDLVKYVLQRDYAGLENLVGIPGTVGAAPVQNIGAYGVEIRDVIQEVTVYDTITHTIRVLSNEDCKFGYRQSIFSLCKNYWIISIVVKLTKKPVLNLQYSAIQEEIQKSGKIPQKPQQVADVIRTIRERKLPDIHTLGNAGSFFKNPIIPQEQYKLLQQKYPNIVMYPSSDGYVKIPAGWLIEHAGWRGHRAGNVGCYAGQALVLVNHGQASGKEILDFATKIQDSVQEKFGISLAPEVLII